jgi:hypothetical protein
VSRAEKPSLSRGSRALPRVSSARAVHVVKRPRSSPPATPARGLPMPVGWSLEHESDRPRQPWQAHRDGSFPSVEGIERQRELPGAVPKYRWIQNQPPHKPASCASKRQTWGWARAWCDCSDSPCSAALRRGNRWGGCPKRPLDSEPTPNYAGWFCQQAPTMGVEAGLARLIGQPPYLFPLCRAELCRARL